MLRARGAYIAIGLLVLGAATAAHAEKAPAPLQITGQVETRATPAGTVTPATNTKWDAAKGRWGFMVSVGRLGDAVKNVLTGAYYRLTPSLRVGSSVGYGSDEGLDAVKKDGGAKSPRVKLEANFSF